jgi:hypothetical protein
LQILENSGRYCDTSIYQYLYQYCRYWKILVKYWYYQYCVPVSRPAASYYPKNLVYDHTMNISAKFVSNLFCGFRKKDENVKFP